MFYHLYLQLYHIFISYPRNTKLNFPDYLNLLGKPLFKNDLSCSLTILKADNLDCISQSLKPIETGDFMPFKLEVLKLKQIWR